MRRIEALGDRIRHHTYPECSNLYDRYFQARRDDWFLLCTTMDILGDTCLALIEYETEGLGQRDGEKYLRLYGVLQSVILQQDAIRHLHRLFVGTDFEPATDSKWKEIRKLRNLIGGHPMDEGGDRKKRRTFLTRTSIADDEFRIIVWNQHTLKEEFTTIEFKALYEAYKMEALSTLGDVHRAETAKYPPDQTRSTYVFIPARN